MRTQLVYEHSARTLNTDVSATDYSRFIMTAGVCRWTAAVHMTAMVVTSVTAALEAAVAAAGSWRARYSTNGQFEAGSGKLRYEQSWLARYGAGASQRFRAMTSSDGISGRVSKASEAPQSTWKFTPGRRD